MGSTRRAWPTRALVRTPGRDLSGALTRHPGPVADAREAARQHARYIEALSGCGLDVRVLPPLSGHPDAHFVEDCAVVLSERRALISRPGAPSRRGEVATVAEALGEHLELVTMRGPGTLDGGDVLRVGDRLFVGRSSRTNDEGIAQLSAAASGSGLRVIPVQVEGSLHLKSVATALSDALVLMVAGSLPASIFAPAGVLTLPADSREAHAANVVRIGSRIVLPSGCPETLALIRGQGLDPIAVPSGEFGKMDGALTCLSILF